MNLIRASFDRAARRYDAAALIQKEAAEHLATMVREEIPSLSSWIDLGSGTGFLSRALHSHFSKAEITLNDLSSEMLKQSMNFGRAEPAAAGSALPSLSILEGNIEEINPEQSWDLIASNFVWQWLHHPHEALLKWSRHGKWIGISMLCDGSFSEWESLHQKLGMHPSSQ